MKHSRWWIFVITLTIGVYAIFLLFSDFSLLIKNLEKIEIQFIIYAVGVFFLGSVIRALRWYYMIRSLNVEIGIKPTLLIYFSGTAFGLSPGRLGEVLKSHYLQLLDKTPFSKTAPTIIVEKFLDVFAIVAIALIAFLLSGIPNSTIFLIMIILGIFSCLIYQKKIVVNILKKTQKIPFLNKISTQLIPSIDVIYLLMKPKLLGKNLVLSIISWIAESSVVFFVLRSFGIELSIIKSAYIFVISSLVGSASFLPGGIGATEGSMLGLLNLEKISYNEAIGPILVIRIIVFWLGIIFGVIMSRITELTILKNKY